MIFRMTDISHRNRVAVRASNHGFESNPVRARQTEGGVRLEMRWVPIVDTQGAVRLTAQWVEQDTDGNQQARVDDLVDDQALSAA